MNPAEYKALLEQALPSGYETLFDGDQYADMEAYGTLWKGREKIRDDLCIICLAIVSDQYSIMDRSKLYELEKGLAFADY